jgi:hypothetical protein
VDEFSIDGGRMLYLASESVGEKAYYLRAVSDKPHGLNGFLNETVVDLRHVVETVKSAREIGVIKKEQVINIIDSVVQRTTFGGGEGAVSINIKDSIVQRTEFKGDEERKKREEERRIKERDKQRKLEAQRKEGELQEQRAKEERQKKRNEEIARIQSEKEEERLRLEKENIGTIKTNHQYRNHNT